MLSASYTACLEPVQNLYTTWIYFDSTVNLKLYRTECWTGWIKQVPFDILKYNSPGNNIQQVKLNFICGLISTNYIEIDFA